MRFSLVTSHRRSLLVNTSCVSQSASPSVMICPAKKSDWPVVSSGFDSQQDMANRTGFLGASYDSLLTIVPIVSSPFHVMIARTVVQSILLYLFPFIGFRIIIDYMCCQMQMGPGE